MKRVLSILSLIFMIAVMFPAESPAPGLCYNVICESDYCNTCACNPLNGQCECEATVCSDDNLCTVDSCDPSTGCVFTEIVCDDGDECTDDSCNGETGQCVNTDNGSCVEKEVCWLTAGGVKFEPLADMRMAQNDNCEGNGPRDSVGGVVYPSCDEDPGNGGNWNHIFHKLQLHLKVTDITVLQCGNVEGIEPGTESPVCPFNFIEFIGTGTLVGIGGNKMEATAVEIFAHVEDRNEPGNENANPDDGSDIDRYFLEVFDAATGDSLLEVSDDGEPMKITGGNFQIHCSSCSD